MDRKRNAKTVAIADTRAVGPTRAANVPYAHQHSSHTALRPFRWQNDQAGMLVDNFRRPSCFTAKMPQIRPEQQENDMPTREDRTTPPEALETKTGEAVPKAVIGSAKSIVEISRQVDPAEEIAAIRGQLEALRQQIAETASGSAMARKASCQVEGTAKVYPVSAVLGVARQRSSVQKQADVLLNRVPAASEIFNELQNRLDYTAGTFNKGWPRATMRGTKVIGAGLVRSFQCVKSH